MFVFDLHAERKQKCENTTNDEKVIFESLSHVCFGYRYCAGVAAVALLEYLPLMCVLPEPLMQVDIATR